MKKTLRIVIITLICIFALLIVKDWIIKSVISVVATNITGAKTEIGSFSMSILRRSVRMGNFKMRNPKGFSAGVLVDLPKISVDYDLFSLLKGQLHLRLLEIELKEIGLEKNNQGKLNVDSLKVTQDEASKEKKPAKPLSIRIDLLNLQMGRLVYKDYTTGGEPAVRVYDINLKKSYKNIGSAQQLVALILAEPMKQAGIKGAQIYGVALLSGVAILPVAVAATFISRDSVQESFDIPSNTLYDTSLSVLKVIGKVKSEDKSSAVIAAEVDGANIKLKLKQISPKKTQITISARKYMLPKPEIASGVLYRISEKLK